MKGLCIFLPSNEVSERGVSVLEQSIKDTESNIDLYKIPAIPLDSVFDVLDDLDLKYTYATEKHKDINFRGLMLNPYKTDDIRKIISCSLSHYALWKMCVELDEDVLILEHDAKFVETFNYEEEHISNYYEGTLGLNNPNRATRRAGKYDAALKKRYKAAQDKFPSFQFMTLDVPDVNMTSELCPQGMAGNSAYCIKPKFAEQAINKIHEIGVWPNDAFLCKELFPGMIKQIYPYRTEVQNLCSTTTKPW